MHPTRSLLLLLLAGIMLLLPSQRMRADDDTLRIVRIDTSGYPTIRVHVRAYCKGVQYSGLNQVDIEVVDGVARSFKVNCPSQTVPMSVALVLDRSGSVAGTTIYRIQQGAAQFVSLFQQHPTGTDEGAIISFSEDVTVDQSMTSDQMLLYSAISRIFPWGNTALWDGVMFGINEVAVNGTNPIKAVVVLSDGDDNQSTADLPDAIRFARQHGIPVYTMCLMYHTTPTAVANMRMLADSTGGLFFPMYHPDDIVPAFRAIQTLITGGANDCVIEYKVECADGSMRTAVVTAQACGKTVTATARYRAPIDQTLPSVNIRFETAEAYENGDLYIPVMISATGSRADISRLDFKILHQDSVDFHRAITDPYFAKNFTVSTSRSVDTLLFHLDGSASLMGEDTLMVLHFKTRSFAKDSTMPLMLFYVDKNTQQCMLLRVSSSDYRVYRRPVLGITCIDTLQVAWDPNAAIYAPNELVFSTGVRNSSDIVARNTRAWITLPLGMVLTSPSDTVRLFGDLGQNAFETVTFRAQIVPTDTAREYVVCVTVKPDSGAATECCTRIVTEAARPALRCSLVMPREARWSDSAQSYIPAVLPVTLTVRNVSPITARPAAAWIDVPDGFTLDAATPRETVLTPSALAQSDTGRVTWLLRVNDRMTSDTVTICVRAAAGGDTAICCERFFVTSSPVRAALVCGNPVFLKYDEEKGVYDPPQFLVTTSVRNISGIDMAQARASITLPSFLTLAPGERQVKDAPNGAVVQAGDSVTIAWVVVASAPPVDGAQVCIDVFAANYPGGRCCTPVRVQTDLAAPVLACSLSGPDTVRSVEGAYVPNPISLDLSVQNVGTSPARTVFAALLQGADLSINAADRALKQLVDSLPGGASVQSRFLIDVLDRTVSRYDTIRVTVYAANGGAIVCEKVIWIEGVRAPLLELACTAPDSLSYVDSLGAYVPTPFILRLTARNVGTAPADSVTAEFLPPPDITLDAGEQPVKLLTPSRLTEGQSGFAEWRVVAVPRTVGRIDTLRAQVRSRGRVLAVTQPCFTPVSVPATRAPRLTLSCAPVSELAVNGALYTPDPFAIRLVVRNDGDGEAFELAASVLSHGRLQRAGGDSAVKLRGTLAKGAQTEFLWYFHATPGATGDSVEVCLRLVSRRGGEQSCCTKIWLPPLPGGGILVACAAPDTVAFNIQNNGYPNPILVTAEVHNPTPRVIDSVHALLVLPAGLQLAAGETADKRLLNIAPAARETVQWLVDVVRDTSTVEKLRRVRVQFSSSDGVRYCDRDILVLPPPPSFDTTAFRVACTAPDSIRFVNAQIGLQPSPFSVSVEIANTGTTPLLNVQATISMPAGATLSPGENQTKSLGAPLPPAQRATLTWSCVPSLSEETRSARFIVRVETQGAAAQTCEPVTVIERVYREIRLSIPRGNVVRSGQAITIPLNFTNPTQATVAYFQTSVVYDPATVQIEGILQAGTLTAAWPALQFTLDTSGRVTIGGSGTQPLAGAGALVLLRLRALSGDGTENPFGVKLSDLTLTDPLVADGIRVELEHGDVVTTGDCLIPLAGSERFALRPNRPNPFNPGTWIPFTLAPGVAGTHVRLEVFDSFGRLVRRVLDGPVAAGEHAVYFDATGLPSGVYFARLAVGDQVHVRPMSLSR